MDDVNTDFILQDLKAISYKILGKIEDQKVSFMSQFFRYCLLYFFVPFN